MVVVVLLCFSLFALIVAVVLVSTRVRPRAPRTVYGTVYGGLRTVYRTQLCPLLMSPVSGFEAYSVRFWSLQCPVLKSGHIVRSTRWGGVSLLKGISLLNVA